MDGMAKQELKVCPACGQVIPFRVRAPSDQRHWVVQYPRLHPDTVREIFADIHKRTWIAKQRGLPIRLVGKIKDCSNITEALIKYAVNRNA